MSDPTTDELLAELDRRDAIAREATPGIVSEREFVEVRIALAVDAAGDWSASGYSRGDEDDMMAVALEGVNQGEARYYWIVARVPLPTELEIEAQAITDPDTP